MTVWCALFISHILIYPDTKQIKLKGYVPYVPTTNNDARIECHLSNHPLFCKLTTSMLSIIPNLLCEVILPVIITLCRQTGVLYEFVNWRSWSVHVMDLKILSTVTLHCEILNEFSCKFICYKEYNLRSIARGYDTLVASLVNVR